MIAVQMPASGLSAGGDGEGHRQRQRHDADRDAGAEVLEEALPVVAGQRVDQSGAEAGELQG